MTTQQNNNITFKDRLSVHLAFALQNKEDVSMECLSSEDLKRLVKGNVSKKEEDAMWAHMDACDDCFDAWMALPSLPKERSILLRFQNALSDFFYDVSDMFQQLFIPRYSIPAFAVVISCLIIIYFQFFQHASVNQLLNNAYQVVVQNKIQNDLRLPWEEEQQKALMGPGLISDTQKAFALGLSHGRDQLKEISKTDLFSEEECTTIVNQNELQCFYYSAKWLILIQSAQLMENEYSDQFWNEQLEVLNILLQMFSLSDETPQNLKDLHERLTQVKDLWQSKETVGKMRWQNSLGKLCHVIIAQFSPKHMSEEQK